VHRRRRVTPYSATTPMRPMGYGGVGPSPALPLLPDTHGIASSRRLGSAGHPPQVGPALVTRPARVLQRPDRLCIKEIGNEQLQKTEDRDLQRRVPGL
jgi:hypothetical protein